ncbi:F-box-like domain protein [Ceratobasidium sp. AG-Ba]|nr:F-box-like domain protein [Ceratobasidium sp. AG-Ba]QRV98811.1 F-box-like domain protein [Ceratobasidium sp. AG-Ba]
MSREEPINIREEPAILGESPYPKAANLLKEAGIALANSLHAQLDASLLIKYLYLNPRSLPVDKLLGEEFTRLISYKSKLDHARAAMALPRNRSPSLVPINAPPRELSSLIFATMVDGEFNRSFGAVEYPATYPKSLLKVCESWYRAITGTPSLWSQVDLLIGGTHTEKFYRSASYPI